MQWLQLLYVTVWKCCSPTVEFYTYIFVDLKVSSYVDGQDGTNQRVAFAVPLLLLLVLCMQVLESTAKAIDNAATFVCI